MRDPNTTDAAPWGTWRVRVERPNEASVQFHGERLVYAATADEALGFARKKYVGWTVTLIGREDD